MAAGQNNVDYRSRLFKGCVRCNTTQLLEDSSAVQMMCFYLLCLFVLGVSAGTSEENLWTHWLDYGVHDECSPSSKCFNREIRDDVSGPFWGNRGKRLPTYKQEILYAEEPQFVIVRGGRVEEMMVDEESPFFHTRGRKRERPPFFTARGKKVKMV